MKNLLLPTLLLFVLAGCATTSKSLDKKYGYQVEPGHELLDAGMIYTMEKTADGRFRLRTYYNETRQMTLERYYQDEKFSIAHGPSRSWSDDGQLWQEGNYKNGMRYGQWTECTPEQSKNGAVHKGNYTKDKKHGLWTITNADGQVTAEEYYDQGALVQKKTINKDNPNDTSVVFKYAKMPAYTCNPALGITNDSICREKSLQWYLASTINYPEFARENYIMGTAYASFMVNTEGKIEEVYVINGLCNDIKKEVIRTINGMQTWKPAEADGKPVKVRFTLPLRFKLE